jgi:hypothetical protein
MKVTLCQTASSTWFTRQRRSLSNSTGLPAGSCQPQAIESGRRRLGLVGAMSAVFHGEKNSRRAYLVSITSISGIPKCS